MFISIHLSLVGVQGIQGRQWYGSDQASSSFGKGLTRHTHSLPAKKQQEMCVCCTTSHDLHAGHKQHRQADWQDGMQAPVCDN
jgi:hypothetical protein